MNSQIKQTRTAQFSHWYPTFSKENEKEIDDLINECCSFTTPSRKRNNKQKTKINKFPVLRTRKISNKIPKWRSIEPTSNIEPIYPVLDEESIPVSNSIPPYYQALDFMEYSISQITHPNSRNRELLMLCIDFDTILTPTELIRIPLHQLNYVAGCLYTIYEQFQEDMDAPYRKRFICKYIEIAAAAYAKHEIKQKRIKFAVLSRFKKYFGKWLVRISFNYMFDHHVFPNVEPTSRLTDALHGTAASIYAGYSFYNLGAGSKTETDPLLQRAIQNWAISGIETIKNNTVTGWIIWVLSFVNIFIPISDIALHIFDLLNSLFRKLPSIFSPTQQQLGHVVEPTSDTDVYDIASSLFSGIENNPGIVASILSVFVVLISCVMLGLNIKDVYNAESLASKFVKAGVAIAKGKTGLYAIIAMIGDLRPWIEATLSSLSLYKSNDTFSKVILSCDIEDTEELKKSDLFTHVEFLTNPINYQRINQTQTEHVKLAWCHSVLSRILQNNVSKPVLSSHAVQLLTKHIADINKVRASVFRYTRDEHVRFVPFWINIYGLAGTRKSTFMSKLAKTMVETLRRLGRYEINGDDNIFAVNFTDKYMTAYRQQKVVIVDDIFQDATPLGDRSSALDLISWVSNIPHHTNQAALDDKGLPFTSQIIISTSNINPTALNRKEIICNEALKRRIRVSITFERDPSAPYDPILGDNIKIFRSDPLKNVNDRQLIPSAQALYALVIKEYIEWYNLQQELIKTGGADSACIDKIFEDLGLSATEQEPDLPPQQNEQSNEESHDVCDDYPAQVEPTSLFTWCKERLGFWNDRAPRIIEIHGLQQFDEELHPELATFNNIYRSYHNHSLINDLEIMDILSYYKFYTERLEKITSAQEQLSACKTWTDKILETIKNVSVWKWIFGAVSMLVAYKWFTSKETPKPEPTAIRYDYGKPVRKPPRTAKAVTPTSMIMDIYREDFSTTGTDSNAMDLVLNNLIGKGGITRLVIPLGNGLCETAVAVRIGGTSILANHHVFTGLKNNQEFIIEIPHYLSAMKPVKQKFNPKRLRRIGNTDSCIYMCDNSMPAGKLLTHHFSNDEVKIKSTNAIIVTRNPESMYVSNVIATPITRPERYVDAHGITEYTTLGGYKVSNYVTTKGMSGSLLVSLDPFNNRKLLGIQTSRHVDTKEGYFQPITESMLLEALKSVGENYEATPADATLVAEACAFVPDNHCPPNLGKQSLFYLGSLDTSSQIQFQKKSKIIPSLVQDKSTLVKAPAALDKYDERLCEEVYGKDLMYKNMEGYDGAEYGSLDTETLDEVTEMMCAEYSCVRSVPGITRRILDENEMVNGIQGRINPIDMTTSPGFPFVKQRRLTGVNGKFEWFDEKICENGKKLYFPKQELRDRIHLREIAAQNGQRIESIAYSCLKDETRPLARVENGITRVFICLPMDYNLLIRKYFGTYIATQHALAGKISSSVGIDPVTGWKGLYERLRSKGTEWEDFDYKNWDQFLHPEFVKRYAMIVNAWYGDENDSPAGKVRHVLMQELVYTYLIVGKKLFMKTGGQCSGCAITAEINCDIHDIIMFYVFCCIVKERNGQDLKDNDDLLTFYRENVELALYGDDIVKSATHDVTTWFNGKTIEPYMKQMGMKITPADKESTEFEIKEPERVTFLKRSFKPDPEYPDRFVRAPLDDKTIWNIPQWIKNCDDSQGATRVNCEMALREVYMYGEAKFNTAREYLNKRIENYNIMHPGAEMRPLTLTYSKLAKAYEEGTLEICYPKGWYDNLEEPVLV